MIAGLDNLNDIRRRETVDSRLIDQSCEMRDHNETELSILETLNKDSSNDHKPNV